MTHQGRSPQQRQADQRRADQRLVGDRVGELAELGDQAALAGELAVDAVGDRRDREDHPRRRSASRSRARRRRTAPRRTPARAPAGTRSARWRCSTPTPGSADRRDRVRLAGLEVERAAGVFTTARGPRRRRRGRRRRCRRRRPGRSVPRSAPGRSARRDAVGLRALVRGAPDRLAVVVGVLDEHLDRSRRRGPRRAGLISSSTSAVTRSTRVGDLVLGRACRRSFSASVPSSSE